MGLVDVDVTAWPLAQARIPQGFDVAIGESMKVRTFAEAAYNQLWRCPPVVLRSPREGGIAASPAIHALRARS